MITSTGIILGLTLPRRPQPKRLTLALVFWLTAGLALAQSLDEYRDQVARLMQDYRWSEALGVASQALEKHPEDPELLVAAAALMLKQGHRENGERLLESAASSPVSDPSLLSVMAELKSTLGQNTGALQLLRKALRRAPDNPVVHYRLARLLFLEGDEGQALTHAGRAVELDSSRSDYREFYALLLESGDRLEEACQQLRLARHRSPFSGRILLRLGDRERTDGRYAQALEYFEMATSVDPENPLYYRKLAETYENLGMGVEATRVNQKAERLERAFESYVQAVGRGVQGGYLEGVENLGKAVDENPEFLTGTLFLADLYRKLGRAEEALTLYLTVLQRDPSSDIARNESAWILMQRGDLDTALEVLRSSLEGNLNEFLLEGYKKLVEKDWAGAVAEFRKVESRYPLQPEVLQQISLCLDSMGRPKEALDYLKKAHSVDPENLKVEEQAREIRFHYGLNLEAEGDWKDALAIFSRLRLEDDENTDYLFHEAYCCHKLGEYEEAVTLYGRGLRLEPGVVWARINLAACFYRLSRCDDAAKQWEYLVRESNQPEYVYNLGLARIRQWKVTEGWVLVRRAADNGYTLAQQLLQAAGIP